MAIPRFSKPRAEPKRKPTPALPIISRRALDLEREGAGAMPCYTAAHSWLGCVSSRDDDGICRATGRRCWQVKGPRSIVLSADLPEDTGAINRLLKPTKGHF